MVFILQYKQSHDDQSLFASYSSYVFWIWGIQGGEEEEEEEEEEENGEDEEQGEEDEEDEDEEDEEEEGTSRRTGVKPLQSGGAGGTGSLAHDFIWGWVRIWATRYEDNSRIFLAEETNANVSIDDGADDNEQVCVVFIGYHTKRFYHTLPRTTFEHLLSCSLSLSLPFPPTPSPPQLAWEVLECARVIFSSQGQEGKAQLAATHQALGEHLMEGGDFDRAAGELGLSDAGLPRVMHITAFLLLLRSFALFIGVYAIV